MAQRYGRQLEAAGEVALLIALSGNGGLFDKNGWTKGMIPDIDTSSPLLSCLDEISPVLFVVFWVGALVAGWILQRHNSLSLKQTYLAMSGRLKVPKPPAFYATTAIWVLGTFGYFAYAYKVVCELPSV